MNILHVVSGIDIAVYHFLGRFAGNWFIDRIVSHEEANNLLKGGLVFAIYWYLWFRNDADREARRRCIISILIGTLLGIVAARSLAFAAPFRARPMWDPAISHSSFSIPLAANLVDWSSFPSDTAAYFCALAFGIGYLVRRLRVPMLLYTGLWICLPRIYMGVHWTSDIFIGAAIGITTTWLSLRSSWLQALVAERIVPAIEKKPEWSYPLAFLASFEMAVIFENCRHLGRALFHLTAKQSYAGVLQVREHTPGDEWTGFIAIAILLVMAASIKFWWSQRRRKVFVGSPLIETMQTSPEIGRSLAAK